MSSTVKSFKVHHSSINARNTFTNGDTLSGQVILEVTKDCQMVSLMIKFKGKAEVRWSERHGKRTVHYHSKDKYFSVKHYFVTEKQPQGDSEALLRQENGENYNSVVGPGRHVYPFTFQFPFRDLPSSFQGTVGKVVYLLEARMGRSMRLDQTDSTTINFEAKTDPSTVPGLMAPQHESKDKKMNMFTKGSVAMDVKLEKSCFFAGEGLKVMASIQNNSSRDIKPKYCIYRKDSFFARGKRRLNLKDMITEVGETVPPSVSTNVTQIIQIPHDVQPTILNCSNIKVEYRLKVYLDVKYGSDPEVKIPVILLQGSQASAAASAQPPDNAAYGFGFDSYKNPDPNPPVWGFGPAQPGYGPAQPGYGPTQPGFGPAQPGYGLAPQGFGTAQPPTAPQPEDQPPAYGSHEIYPPLTDYGNKY